MTQQVINVGLAPNDGLGDPIRTAYIKCNDNFSQLYSRVQVTPPTTLVGSVGDQAGMYAYDPSYFYYCFQNYDGSSIIWAQVAQVGNIIATQIVSGNTSVSITDLGGNVTFDVGGTSNVLVVTPQSANVTGTLDVFGNVVAGNIRTFFGISAIGNITGDYIFGNGSQLTGLPELYGNANVADYLTVYSGDISANNITTTGNITGLNVSTTGNVLSQGVVSALGNVETSGYFVGTFLGNITGNFVVPGSNTQVLFNTNGNADATAGFTYSKDSNTVSVLGIISSTGNVQAGNLRSTGQLSVAGNITGGNLNISGGINDIGNITGGNLLTGGLVSATGNITGGNIVSNGAFTVAGNITAGNVLTGGVISATGNISTGGLFYALGDVNAGGNVSATNYTGSLLSVTGNITGGNLRTGGLISATGGVTSLNLNASGPVSAAGNVTGSNLITGGNILGSGLLSVTGNITGGNLATGGDFTVGGLFVATGNITGGNLRTLGEVSAAGNVTGGNLVTGGLLSVASTISATGNVTGGNVLTAGLISAGGNVTAGGNLSIGGIISAGGNITGTNLTLSNTTINGNILTTGLISATGNITGGGILTINSGGAATAIVNAGANAVGNIGSSTNYFNRVFAQATTALYADLAENYLADAEYEPGTVLCFEGTQEVTQCNSDSCATIAGVVSENPAYIMNSGLKGEHVVSVALVGRVPCKVVGPVKRGAMMVSAGNGMARAEANPAIGTVIGKALKNFDGVTGTIEIVVGRL